MRIGCLRSDLVCRSRLERNGLYCMVSYTEMFSLLPIAKSAPIDGSSSATVLHYISIYNSTRALFRTQKITEFRNISGQLHIIAQKATRHNFL